VDLVTSFESFYRQHYNLVLRFAERRLADRETAREVCAESFVIAWKKFDPIVPLSLAWLYGTTRNLIGDVYRRERRDRRLLVQLRAHASIRWSVQEFDGLSSAMQCLNEKDREALQLTYWEGLSAAEVGVVLKCTEQAAWARISRAKRTLRREIERASSVNFEVEVS